MIGHYLLSLTPEQEERVLTMPMRNGPYFTKVDGCRCLVGVAHDVSGEYTMTIAELFSAMGDEHRTWQDRIDPRRRDWMRSGIMYDRLCSRFGLARVNAAIRARILANQIRRVLPPGFYAKPRADVMQHA